MNIIMAILTIILLGIIFMYIGIILTDKFDKILID